MRCENMNKEWILNSDDSIRATFWENNTVEIEKFDENNDFESRVILSNEAFEEIMNNYVK